MNPKDLLPDGAVCDYRWDREFRGIPVTVRVHMEDEPSNTHIEGEAQIMGVGKVEFGTYE